MHSKLARLILVVLALMSGHAVNAQNAVSVPSGYLRVTLAPGEQKLASTPFQAATDDSIQEVLKGQLSPGTNEATADVVLQWRNTPAPGYLRALRGVAPKGSGEGPEQAREAQVTSWFDDFATWTPSSMTLSPGIGFILGNRQTYTQEVWLAGDVLMDDDIALTLPPGLSLFGVPYLTPAEWNLPEGDRITDATHLLPGQGYWYVRNALDAVTLKCLRPHSNPIDLHVFVSQKPGIGREKMFQPANA